MKFLTMVNFIAKTALDSFKIYLRVTPRMLHKLYQRTIVSKDNIILLACKTI